MYHDNYLPSHDMGNGFDFEGLLFPLFETSNLVEFEAHASLDEIDWLAELLANEHIVYFGVGLGLWAAHLAATAQSVRVHDRSDEYLKQAMCVAWANNRTAMVRLTEEDSSFPPYHEQPMTVVINLRREPSVEKALAYRPERIVMFGPCSPSAALTLLKAGYSHDSSHTGAAVFVR